MKRFLLSVALLSVGAAGFAQQDKQFSHFMFDRLSINPGSAGMGDAICATLMYRNQWMGFDGAPKTSLVNIQGPVKLARGGVGLSVFDDRLGQEQNLFARGAYSYHLGAGPGTLGIGVSGGIVSKTLGADWVATDGYLSDAAIPDAGVSNTTFDMGAGLYYTIPDQMYVGLSATHLTQGDLVDLNIQMASHVYVMAGYTYKLNQTWQLQPNLLAKTDLASTQIDVNCMALYNNMLWGGVSYRTADAIIPFVGFQKGINAKGNDMLKIGLSYDVTTSQLKNHSNGTFELMLNYCFKLDPPEKIQKYKNVRFL